MGGSVRLGRVFDIEIRLDYSWFFVFFLVAWSLSGGLFPQLGFAPGTSWVLGIVAAILLFVSVLVHEISHALMARRFDIEVDGITLFLFGGVAQIKGEPATPKAEFFIAGVGPLVSVIIGAVSLAVAFGIGFTGLKALAAVFGYLGAINITLALFNLVPGFPLDGGRLLRSAVWHFTGNVRKATRWASNMGRLFAWILIAYGVMQILGIGGRSNIVGGFWMVLVGWFLNNAAQTAYQQLLLKRALSGVAVADVMSHNLPTIDADMRVSDFIPQFLVPYDFLAYPVVRHGEFVGVVTVDDIRRLPGDTWGVTCVGALAHPPENERVIDEYQDAWDALTQMLENNVPRLLVMHNGQLQGVVSRDAIVRLVQAKMQFGARP